MLHSLQQFLFVAAFILSTRRTSAFAPIPINSGCGILHRSNGLHQSAPPLVLLRMSQTPEDEEAHKASSEEKEEVTPDPSKPAQDPTPPPQMARTPPSPPPKRLDPLLASLTRVDPQANVNAPKKNLPLLGEVTLDQNLFVLLPVAAFAVLGFVSFLLVALNSQDALVNAINEWNDSVINPPPPAPIDPNECRGLCSSQQEDLEGLRSFMEGISRKK